MVIDIYRYITRASQPRVSFLISMSPSLFIFFFFNDTATTEIYTLSLHDALPISQRRCLRKCRRRPDYRPWPSHLTKRSEEHTSELQSRSDLVCRLLLEKKNSCPRRQGSPTRTT